MPPSPGGGGGREGGRGEQRGLSLSRRTTNYKSAVGLEVWKSPLQQNI